MKFALSSTGRGVKTRQVIRRVHLRIMRRLALLLLPAALHASAVTTTDQLTTLFCGQIQSCWDYPVLPPALPQIPEAPGYTLGPYVGTLILDGLTVPDYPGTIEEFLAAAIPAAEDWGFSDGYASFFIDVSGGYVFSMAAGPELVSSIDPVPEPSSIVLAGLGVALIGTTHLCRHRAA
jgi:PEP-CTERM motif